MTALTLYYTSQASSVTNAAAAGTASGGTQGNGTLSLSRPVIGTYLEMRKATGLAGGTTLPAASTYGQLLDSTLLEGKTLTAGTWTGTFNFKYTGVAVTGRPWIQVFKRSGAGVYTSLGSGNAGADVTLTTSYVAKTITFSIATDTLFTTGDKLYFELYFVNSARPGTGTDSIEWYLATTTTGVTTAQLVTPGYTVTPTTYSRSITGISADIQGRSQITGVTAALSGPGPLVLYGSNVPDGTLTTACDMAANTSGGVEVAVTTTWTASDHYVEVWSKGNASLATVSGAPTAPTGNGWAYTPGAGTFAAGNWSASVTVAMTAANVGAHTMRFYRLPGGVLANAVSIGNLTYTPTVATKSTYAIPAVSMAATTFAATDVLYVDYWYQDSTFFSAGDHCTIYESTSAAAGVTNEMQVTTSTFTPETITTFTRPISGISSALQALDVKRGISGVSGATQALGVERPVVSVSTAVQALDIKRGISGVSTSVSALATSTRPITGVSATLQALGLTRPVVGVSGATQALGLTRPVVGISASLVFTGARPVVGVLAALLASQITRPISSVGASLLFTGARPITSVSAATKAFGVERSLPSLSASLSTTGPTTYTRAISGVSVSVQTIWRVSGAVGSSGNGKTWATAWKAFSNIAWASVQPGDVIEVDGGASGITYAQALVIGKSGTAGSPITIRASQEAGHNGTVTQWGGRTTPLPYAGQPTGSWSETSTFNNYMIDFDTYSYVTVDGSRWNGWHIYGTNRHGITIWPATSHNTVRYLEINDCGIATSGVNGWSTDYAGIVPMGDDITVEYCNLHDNGQDCMQTGDPTNNFTIRKTWMHYLRENPDYPGYSYNMTRPDTSVGTHNDGYQNYGTTAYTGVAFEDCLFGPGLMNGIIINTVAGLSFSQCLFFPGTPAMGNGIMVQPGYNGTGGTIDHCTFLEIPGLGNSAIYVDGTGNSVTNTIARGAGLHMGTALVSNAGNIQYSCTGNTSIFGGTTVDPNFVTNVTGWTTQPTFSTLGTTDLTPQAGAAVGKGVTDFTSIDSFLTFVGATSVTHNSRAISSVSVAVQALGLTRPVVGMSVAVQALGLVRTIIGVSAATLQSGITRPLTGISVSLSVTYIRPITGITSVLQAFGVPRNISSVSAAVGVGGIQRVITGVTVATKQLGATRPLVDVSVATIQPGITRPLVGLSASVVLTASRPISGVSTALKATGVERPVVSVSAAAKALGVSRPIVGVTSAVGQGGISRTIIGVSVAVQAFGVPRNITGVSSALQAIGVTRSLVGVSGAVKQIGLTRDISGVSVALAQTVSRTVIGVTSAVQALSLLRPIVNVSSSVTLRTGKTVIGVSSTVKALGVARPITGILGAIGVAGITRPLTNISASLSFSGKMYTSITVIGTRGNVTVEGTRGTITALGSRGTITVQEE